MAFEVQFDMGRSKNVFSSLAFSKHFSPIREGMRGNKNFL